MRVATIDVFVNDPRVTRLDFHSTNSIFEYDVAIWDPVNTLKTYEGPYGFEHFQSLPSINENGSARLLTDIRRRKEEFAEYLKMGRTLVVFASPPVEVYVDTGKKETSGSGRNQKVTRIVSKIDILDALPYENISVAATGYSIDCKRADFGELVAATREWWYYRALLQEFPGEPLAVVTGTDKVNASIKTLANGGHIIQIPDLDFVDPLDEPSADEDEQEPNSYTREAWEQDVKEERELHKLFVDWIEELRGGTDDDTPEWARQLHFHEEIPRINEIAKLQRKSDEIGKEIAELRQESAKDDTWKNLIVSSGLKLERAVADAFRVLGFEILGQEVGRSDLRISLGGRYAVVEVKGVKKSASEANAAQLEKWVSSALLENGVAHKGILVVNTWREKPIFERNQADFPDQMMSYVNARGHCLLTGLQLLIMTRQVIVTGEIGNASAQIMDCVGRFPSNEDASRIFGSIQETEAEATVESTDDCR